MSEIVLLTELRDGVLWLIMNRPQVRNALDHRLSRELLAAVKEAVEDPRVKALVLAGKGKCFCAGVDLNTLEALVEASAEEHRAHGEALRDLFLSFYLCPKPVVTAVQGAAVAGGCGLATVCDVTVASPEARFGYTEVRIGFIAALVAVFLLRAVGEKNARHLLLGGHLVSAAEALRMGLVQRVSDGPEELEAAAQEEALRMAANAPGSLAMTKELVARLPGEPLEMGLRWAADLNALCRSGAELREGVRAFLEKRDPPWRS